MFRQGVLVSLSSGLAGKDGDAIVFGPPFIIERQQSNSAVDTLAVALQEVIAAYMIVKFFFNAQLDNCRTHMGYPDDGFMASLAGPKDPRWPPAAPTITYGPLCACS